jgi:hypothetical protein
MTVTLRLQPTYNMVPEVLRKYQKLTLSQKQASKVSTLFVIIQRIPCIH